MALNFRLAGRLLPTVRKLIPRICSLSTETTKKIKDVKNKEETQDEASWFSAITQPEKEANLNFENANYFSQFDRNKTTASYLKNLDKDSKRKAINELVISMQANTFGIPTDYDEAEWEMLDKIESLTHLRETLRKIAKDRHYKLLKVKRKLVIEKRKESTQIKRDSMEANDSPITNYPGYSSFLKHISTTDYRVLKRHNMLASIRTDAPKVVFDFRYESTHTKEHIFTSLYRQFIHVLSVSKGAPEPFQVFFCNYDKNGRFNSKFKDLLNLDENLIFETSKSYLELGVPKENLVYLSKDAKETMKAYDPDKVYIIGSIIDCNYQAHKYASLSQAKRDGITCQRLPIDENIKWSCGQKDLNINHVYEILIKLYHGNSWKQALETTLPKRKIEVRSKETNFD